MNLLYTDLESLGDAIELLRQKLHALVVEERKSFAHTEVIKLSQKLDGYLAQYTEKRKIG